MSQVERDLCGFRAPSLRKRDTEKLMPKKKGLAVTPALQTKITVQNVKWTPNSLQIERGMKVAVGAKNPMGWPKVALEMLPPKLLP